MSLAERRVVLNKDVNGSGECLPRSPLRVFSPLGSRDHGVSKMSFGSLGSPGGLHKEPIT